MTVSAFQYPKEKTVIRTKVINDSLKYFYTDYKNYYYLPKEDMAIHKSVAAYVDRDHKKKNAKHQTAI